MVLEMAFPTQKTFGTFKKQAPGQEDVQIGEGGAAKDHSISSL